MNFKQAAFWCTFFEVETVKTRLRMKFGEGLTAINKNVYAMWEFGVKNNKYFLNIARRDGNPNTHLNHLGQLTRSRQAQKNTEVNGQR